MIDIELIRTQPDLVAAALSKRAEIDLAPILELDRTRRSLLSEVESARAEQNKLSKTIGEMRRAGSNSTDLEAESTKLRERGAAVALELGDVESRLRNLLMELPNLPDERVPAGGKESNQVVKTWGTRPTLPEKSKDHVELCTNLGLVDYERGTKLGGNGFWLYTGLGAALEWALIDFFCREHFAAGYQFLLPPHLLSDECGYATGQFPKFYDDVFHLDITEGRSSFLLPTSETAILNVYRDEILPMDDLPLKAFSYTPCYRREAGSHRTNERGTIRGHQFNKVEMFQFTTPEEGEQALGELVGRAEALLEKLGLHYQTSLLAARDASATMAMTYDVEVWIPSIGGYKEVSSASWAKDYQARRANIRFKRAKGSRTEYVHTLNASGLATSRLVPAIVEQFQQADGSVVVPEPLRHWVGREVIEPGL